MCARGEYAFKENRKTDFDFVKRTYLEYFCVRFGDQDKTWLSHEVYKIYLEHLRQRSKRNRNSLKFCVGMVWSKNYIDDCYFILVNNTGINRNNRNKVDLS